jgi:hypothetical protein
MILQMEILLLCNPSLIFLDFWVWRHSEHSKDMDSISHTSSHVMSCFFS